MRLLAVYDDLEYPVCRKGSGRSSPAAAQTALEKRSA